MNKKLLKELILTDLFSTQEWWNEREQIHDFEDKFTKKLNRSKQRIESWFDELSTEE